MIPDLRDTILNTWRTNNRVTLFLVERIPPELWASAIPGAPRRTIQMMAAHIHNVRHVLAYFVAHEAHHRGHIVVVGRVVVVGRALGYRLPAEVTDGLWQWTKRAAEAGVVRRPRR